MIAEARMDPWSLVPAGDAERLFGFLVRHPVLGGGSWSVSSPIVSRRGGQAVTASGKRYDLGEQISPDDLPTEEARAALQALVYSNGDRDTIAWLQACKIARWLCVPSPDRRDVAGVQEFLLTHRDRYMALRHASPLGDYRR